MRTDEHASAPARALCEEGGCVMRAFALDDFGGSATLRDMPAPMPEEGDVRVRVLAAGVNPLDSAIARGAISPRVKEAMRARLPLVLGMDVSGIVDLLGPGVHTVAVGDEVYGLPGKPFFGGGPLAGPAGVAARPHGPQAAAPRPPGGRAAALAGHAPPGPPGT